MPWPAKNILTKKLPGGLIPPGGGVDLLVPWMYFFLLVACSIHSRVRLKNSSPAYSVSSSSTFPQRLRSTVHHLLPRLYCQPCPPPVRLSCNITTQPPRVAYYPPHLSHPPTCSFRFLFRFIPSHAVSEGSGIIIRLPADIARERCGIGAMSAGVG